MITSELIDKYTFERLENYKELRVEDYILNGTTIIINYSYQYDWSTDRSYGNSIQVELLDYITWLFNQK
jgi:hypothetical protein